MDHVHRDGERLLPFRAWVAAEFGTSDEGAAGLLAIRDVRDTDVSTNVSMPGEDWQPPLGVKKRLTLAQH